MKKSHGQKVSLKEFISSEVFSLLKEDYARGIPDFVLSNIASDACSDLKKHLKIHAQLISPNPTSQRELLGHMNLVLEEMEIEMKELMEQKLQDYLRGT